MTGTEFHLLLNRLRSCGLSQAQVQQMEQSQAMQMDQAGPAILVGKKKRPDAGADVGIMIEK